VSDPALPADRVILGRIVGVHGVKGWVKLESETRPREAIFEYGPWDLGTARGWHSRKVLGGRPSGSGLTAQLEGIEDRDQARELIGASIAIPRDRLPPPEPGSYYWADLQGCKVVNRQDIDLGTVSHLIETGANDVLVVNNGHERLIPYIESVVLEVDLARHVIHVDWDEDF
jgi:16S rRNA processing protein RimM